MRFNLGRTIVVGDIHGCYDELVALLERARVGRDDRVVSVGDLVTKGEKNRDVLELFMSDERFSAVVGNHDRARSCASLSVRRELEAGRARYEAYLASLPYLIDLGSHVVVHAGLRPGVPLREQSPDDMTELRTLGPDRRSREGVPWYAVYDGEQTALFGHWPAAELRRGPRALGLDTGCVYGYALTGYVVETGELVSVPALRRYSEG